MAFSDHEVIDAIKTNFGDSNMDDETLQATVEDRFRRSSPEARAETLVLLSNAIKGDGDAIPLTEMRKTAPLWVLERRLREVDQQYRRLGR